MKIFSQIQPEKEQIKFSAVVTVHNEEKFLLYSIPSLFQLKPDQIIVVLDRCEDRSEEVVHELIKKFKYEGSIDIVKIRKKPKDWKWQLSYLYYVGIKKARNDIVFFIGADTKFGTCLKKHLRRFKDEKVGWISFGYRNYPFEYSSWMRHKIQKVHTRRTPAGLNHFFRKSIIENEIEKMKRIPRSPDAFTYNESIRKGYKNLFFQSDTVHLKPLKQKRWYKSGISRYIFGQSFPSILWNACLYFRPLMIAGFLKAKLARLKKHEI